MKINEAYEIIKEEASINEKLTAVDEDVNFIYDTYFKKDVDQIKETGIITKEMFTKNAINTEDLKDAESVEANKLNKCDILINYGGNFYQPSKRKISVSIHSGAVGFVIEYGKGYLADAVNELGIRTQKESMQREFTEEKIKGSIHHELAHWIDDTMNNQHIYKRLLTAREGGNKHVNATKMEIQGQIHNIKQLYNKNKGVWDEWTFEQLLRNSPTLNKINNELPFKLRDQWVKDIKKRMHRENLLGKRMYN